MKLSGTSDLLFWIATVAYVMAMGLHFAHLAWGRKPVGTVAFAVTVAGAAAHLGAILARALAAGRVPWANMYEYSNVLAFLMVVGYLVLVQPKRRLRSIGGFVMLIAAVTMFSARTLYAPPGPLVPALNSWWLKVHVISAIVASAIFSLGFVFTVLYLVKERSERPMVLAWGAVGAAFVGTSVEGFPADHIDEGSGAAAPGPGAGIVAQLPAADTLDTFAYRLIAVAFPIWTWAVVAGAIWASKVWGRYWGWDPKETWAFITWVIYAAYLHARATAGWRGRRAAVIAAAGFICLWITYYVVNLWVVGLHSYAGVG